MTQFKKHHPLPDADHVMRRVAPRLQDRDSNGNPIGFLAEAFAHKVDEPYVSLNWLERFGGDYAQNVVASIAQLKTVLKGNQAKFGVAQVGRVKALAQSNAKPVRLVYWPTPDNAAHSALFFPHPTPDTGREDLAREFYKQCY